MTWGISMENGSPILASIASHQVPMDTIRICTNCPVLVLVYRFPTGIGRGTPEGNRWMYGSCAPTFGSTLKWMGRIDTGLTGFGVG